MASTKNPTLFEPGSSFEAASCHAPRVCRQSRSYSKRSGGRQLSATAAPREEMRTMVTAPRPPRTPMRGCHSSFQEKRRARRAKNSRPFSLVCSRLSLIALSFPRAASEFREWKKCIARRAVPKNPPSLVPGRQGIVSEGGARRITMMPAQSRKFLALSKS